MSEIRNSYDNIDEKKLLSFLGNMPVSINNLYGDPFIPAQIKNTFYKLSTLREAKHKGPISVITKFNLTKEIMIRLSDYQNMENLIFFYSLTGFNEGKVPFSERIKAYMCLAYTMPNVILLFRPIIAGRNDSSEIIQQMIKICKDSATPLVYTPLYTREAGKTIKILSMGVEEKIKEEATKQEVKIFPKSACATKDILNSDICYAHVNQKPQNLDLLKCFYSFDIENDVVVLQSGTHGDYNFVRFITHSNPKIIKEKRERFLSFTPFPLLVSSSWFSWADITHCGIKCDYCLIDVYPESIEHKKIGCNPGDVLELIKG